MNYHLNIEKVNIFIDYFLSLGLAIASEWRGMGLVINLVKRGASRVSGEHMHLFNLKKDRRLFPCAELNVWWYPLK